MTTTRSAVLTLAATVVLAATGMAQDEGRSSREQRTLEADEVRFGLIEDHVRTMEYCMAEITRLSNMDHGAHKVLRNQEDHYSNKIARLAQMKEEAGHGIEDIIVHYFMQVRLRWWEGLPKNMEDRSTWKFGPDTWVKTDDARVLPGYLRYAGLLENLHNALVYTLWSRELTMPEKPRAVRRYITKFKEAFYASENQFFRSRNYHN